MHTPLELNADGFRDRDYAKAKPPGVRRIVGIGDSYMFGWGVRTGKDYLSVLEERLAPRCPDARWEVLNMAVPGYNTAMEVETLRARGLAYEPDVVVVGFVLERRRPPELRPHAGRVPLAPPPLPARLRPRAPRADGARRTRRGGPTAPLFESDPSRAPEAYRDLVGWGAFEAALDDLAALARAHGFRSLFVLFEPDGVGGPLRDERRSRALAEAAARGLAVVDVGRCRPSGCGSASIPAFYGSTAHR